MLFVIHKFFCFFFNAAIDDSLQFSAIDSSDLCSFLKGTDKQQALQTWILWSGDALAEETCLSA